MSQYDHEDDQQLQAMDLNDSEVGKYVPEYDPNVVPAMHFAPVDDGPHYVIVRLRRDNPKGAAYTKGDKDRNGKIINQKMVANLIPRIYNEETGEEGGFLKDWWPTTQVMKGQSSSQIAAICYLAGKPLDYNLSLDKIMRHFLTIFENAGDAGVKLLVRTRWTMAVPKVGEDGMPVYKEGVFDSKGDPVKDYFEFRGQKKIKTMAKVQATEDVLTWEQGEDETLEDFEERKQNWIATSDERAHIYVDPLDGSEKSCQAEVAELLDHTKLVQKKK